MEESDFNEIQSRLKANQNKPESSTTTTTGGGIEPNILKLSREHFEKEEFERSKQSKLQRMKEQHRQLEQSLPQPKSELISQSTTTTTTTTEPSTHDATPATSLSSIANSILTSSSSNILPTTETPLSNASQTTTAWRNLVGAGAAPKLNAKDEFPSLSTGGPSNTIRGDTLFSSLSSTIKTDNKTNAWKVGGNASSKESQAGLLAGAAAKRDKEPEIVAKKGKNKNKKKNNSNSNSNNAHKKDAQDEIAEFLAESPPPTPPPPGFKQTNKPKEIVTCLPPGFDKTTTTTTTTTTEYLKPLNYDQRNQDLTARLFNLFGHYNEKEFQQFKTSSIEFRQQSSSSMNARDYLQKCLVLLDLPLVASAYSSSIHHKKKSNSSSLSDAANKSLLIKFLDLVQEMIVLLPDGQKQAQLYEAYVELMDEFKFGVDRLVACDRCEQLFSKAELSAHQSSQHRPSNVTGQSQQQAKSELVEEFPCLGAISPKVNDDFPSLASKSKLVTKDADFPALSAGSLSMSSENRFSTMPTASIFANPNSHLSLVKKKHRLQK
jgi:hypothetical protein